MFARDIALMRREVCYGAYVYTRKTRHMRDTSLSHERCHDIVCGRRWWWQRQAGKLSLMWCA